MREIMGEVVMCNPKALNRVSSPSARFGMVVVVMNARPPLPLTILSQSSPHGPPPHPRPSTLKVAGEPPDNSGECSSSSCLLPLASQPTPPRPSPLEVVAELPLTPASVLFFLGWLLRIVSPVAKGHSRGKALRQLAAESASRSRPACYNKRESNFFGDYIFEDVKSVENRGRGVPLLLRREASGDWDGKRRSGLRSTAKREAAKQDLAIGNATKQNRPTSEWDDELLRSDLEIGGQYSRRYQIRGACRLTKPISHGDLRLGRSFAWSVNRSSQFATMPSDMEESSDTDGGGEGGSSELDLESSPETLKIKLLMAEDDNKLDCEGDIVEEDGGDAFEDTLGLPDAEADGKKEITKKIHGSELLKIMGNHSSPNNALDQWVGGGNSFGPSEVSFVVLNLRKRGWYVKALQFMEWVEAHKHIKYGEREYASHLDLVVKVLGLHKAENYIKTIPESFRGELVYRTLLANCVVAVYLKKAEKVFNKIRDLGLPISTFSFNQLLLLYKRVDPKKISDGLQLMEKQEAMPSLFTYRLLVDIKGQRYDISGMEEVIATMKAEGMEPNLFLQVIIAKHYAAAGKKEKAEKMARDMEGDDIAENCAACNLLLSLYASLGKIDDVERLWKVC
ncbi:Pentatricopeptide repeat-containing protein [Platanthera guangdongensis]|uniref:Pentatricopeptide repeat-containing protein n=1 Tax=Platanthera guangdongensis TaxID=2320717 RepID=A0ABR2M8B0_9ASPA